MNNPAYVIYKNEDGQVVFVCSWEYESVPDGHTMELVDWNRDIQWYSFKSYRGEDGVYYQSEVLHPDDNDGLL